MFAMGVTVSCSKKNSPGGLFRRGIRLYVLGFVLNFFQYGIYALADGLLSGTFRIPAMRSSYRTSSISRAWR